MSIRKIVCAARILGITAAVMAAAGTVSSVRAATLSDFLRDGQFSGQLRAYYFRREYASRSKLNASAFALGGLFNYKSAQVLHGLSFAVSYFTANALGTHNSNPERIDTTLIGRANSINALGQAYVQYKHSRTLVRLGDQLLKTPWAGPSDSRVLPSTYQAAYGRITPVRGLSLSAVRIVRYKGRTSGGYFRENNYYLATWNGGVNYGGLGDLPSDAPGTAGALAFGATYRMAALKATAWYYNFYGFAHLFYGQAGESFRLDAPIKPFVGVQVVREWGRANVFERTATHLFGQPGTAVRNFTLGAIVGVKGGGGSVSLAYNRLRPEGSGSFGGGAVVSPYTQSFATDPLYTSSMIRGMVELGPGSAWKVAIREHALQRRLELIVSFAEYHTSFNGNDSETYFDVIYRPHGWLEGFTVRDRLEFSNGHVNPGHRSFLYNRVMLSYSL